MSHFKTFFIFAFVFIAKASFAQTCVEDHMKAQEFCYKETYTWVQTVDMAASEDDARAALKHIREVHKTCFELVTQCKKSCRFESKNTSDSTDIRAFNLLLNCESGDISRALHEKLSGKASAERIAAGRNLNTLMGEKENRSSGPSTGMTTLPGFMGSIGIQ